MCTPRTLPLLPSLHIAHRLLTHCCAPYRLPGMVLRLRGISLPRLPPARHSHHCLRLPLSPPPGLRRINRLVDATAAHAFAAHSPRAAHLPPSPHSYRTHCALLISLHEMDSRADARGRNRRNGTNKQHGENASSRCALLVTYLRWRLYMNASLQHNALVRVISPGIARRASLILTLLVHSSGYSGISSAP